MQGKGKRKGKHIEGRTQKGVRTKNESRKGSEDGSDSSYEGETSTVEELVSSCGALRAHHDAYLELFKNAPSCFCKSQGGKRHSFELLVALISRGDGLRYVGHTYDLTAYLLYSDNLALVRQPKTLKTPIFQVMEGSSGILKDGIASVRLRINDVARNHCCRKFRVVLMPRMPGEIPSLPDFAQVFNLGRARSASSKARLRQWKSLCRLGLNVPAELIEAGEEQHVPTVTCGNVEIEERITSLETKQKLQKKRKTKSTRRKDRGTASGGKVVASRGKAAASGADGGGKAAEKEASAQGSAEKRKGGSVSQRESIDAIAACITEPISVISKNPNVGFNTYK